LRRQFSANAATDAVFKVALKGSNGLLVGEIDAWLYPLRNI
jgi:hypothetical protein